MTQTTLNETLRALEIAPVQSGACLGPGGWLPGSAADEYPVRNPATGEPLAGLRPATGDDLERVIAHATVAFRHWRSVPAPRRGQLIRALGDELRRFKEPLGRLISLEVGKILAEGLGEVQEMIDMCDLAVGLSRQLHGLTLPSERADHFMAEQWHPLGPTGVITAFNFPMAVWSWNAALAIVCGDPVIWKPSPLAPLSAAAVQQICNRIQAEHGFDGLFTLAAGGGDVGAQLCADPRAPLISFTGSIRTGRAVAQAVAGRLGRTILELGGNNAIVVLADADLDLAVRAILFGAVGTAGQRCTTTRRLIVQRPLVEPLVARLIDAYGQVRIGDPLEPGTLMGPLISADAVARMLAALRRAVAEGGEVVYGGGARPDLGPNFVEPAIVRMPAQTPLVCDETFAPILYVLACDTFGEAVALHNGVPQGLSSAIFTRDVRAAHAFLAATGSDCGIANVNIGTSGAEIGGAFGGEKDTGGGREAGSDAWKAYMRRQTNTINWSDALPLAQGIRFEVGSS
jgi:aldehyde dehydrogenase (NAD+)